MRSGFGMEEKMGRRRFLHSVSLVVTTSAAVAILATAAWAAGTPQVIYSFAGEDDASTPTLIW